ncbi:MAG: hypothetical protein GY850_33095 [bacterium]|nr:hypothetical protein [bacterium]
MKIRNKIACCFCAVLFLFLFSFACPLEAGVLPVPLKNSSESNSWCWAITAASLITFYGYDTEACEAAEWAMSEKNGTQLDCCSTPLDPLCEASNWLHGNNYTVDQILLNLGGISSSVLGRAATPAELVTQFNNGRPAAARWGFTPYDIEEGAHQLTIAGFIGGDADNGIIHFGDGNLADKSWHTMSYDAFKNSPGYPGFTTNWDAWTRTLMLDSPSRIGVDVYVNNQQGPNFYIRRGSYFYVTLRLYDNGWNENVDVIFVLLTSNSVYYLNHYGQAVTSPSVWKTGPASSLNIFEVFPYSWPTANESIRFALVVDPNGNGLIDGNEYDWYFDYINVITY